MSGTTEQPAIRRYLLIATTETQRVEADGGITMLPAGTVLNEVLWDGVSDWTPPEGTRLEPAIAQG
jgi:hypothetical protein